MLKNLPLPPTFTHSGATSHPYHAYGLMVVAFATYSRALEEPRLRRLSRFRHRVFRFGSQRRRPLIRRQACDGQPILGIVAAWVAQTGRDEEA